MTRIIGVAVLECDTPINPVKARYGTYGDLFQLLLNSGLKGLEEPSDIEIQVTKWDVVNTHVYPKPEEFDALLLTGSKHDAFGDEPWIVRLTDYTERVYKETKKPIVGICFGHQILARALGARLGRSDTGWEVAVETFALSETGKKLFSKNALALHQMHQDITYEIPDGCVNMGSSTRCEIQGLYQPGRIFTVQGHPEFNGFIMNNLVEFRHSQNIFDDELYRDALPRAGIDHDGVLVATAICQFLL